MPEDYSHDVFVSHATEDKDRFVRPFAEALRSREVTVWYDEWELSVGDQLVEKIQDGLRRSRFGVVVLSPAFFGKNWSRAELQAFAAIEMRQSRAILLPIWLDVGADEIADLAPLLLGRVALMASEGPDSVADKVATTIKAGRGVRRLKAPPSPPTLYPSEIQSKSLPHTFLPPLCSDEAGFVFRTVTAITLPLARDTHLNSRHKRAFQAALSESSIAALIDDLVAQPSGHAYAQWKHAQPNTGTAVTVGRPLETMTLGQGSLEGRAGLHLRLFANGTAHATVHVDIVARTLANMTARSVFSLEDFYLLLKIPAASVRDEIAPVVSTQLTGIDEPTLVAQSVVALPQRSGFDPYLDLSIWAKDRADEATGPLAVHWNAADVSEIETPDAWHRTVLNMIDRLFSDGSFLDYEQALDRLDGP